ncbi:hypothetical protein JTB14_038174 [Gonioctena quinquepunctata]|nr:hypothetical protein JTB14_038174 [Gonioctena quinquepunctata]
MDSCVLYECDVCLKIELVRLLPLVGHERILALKLVNSAKRSDILGVKACKTCLSKLRFVKYHLLRKSRISRKLVNSQFIMFPSEYTHIGEQIPLEPEPEGRESFLGQYFSLPPEGQNRNVDVALSGDRLTSEPSEDRLTPDQSEYQRVEQCINDYNCQCESCKNKYGSLPLLLQGIEHKSSSQKTEPQPSTSSQNVPKKVFTCEYCKKTFTHKGDFNKHLRKHTREKPYSCPTCQRKFAHTSNLQRHQRLHTGDKPFVCSNCNRTFSRKDKLDCHRRSRTCSGTSNFGNP